MTWFRAAANGQVPVVTTTGLKLAARRAVPWAGFSLLLLQPLWFAVFWQSPDVAIDAPQLLELSEQVAVGQWPYRSWPGYGPDLMADDSWIFPNEVGCPYPPFIGAAISVLPPLAMSTWIHLWWVVAVGAFWGYAGVLAALAGQVGWRSTFSWALVLMLLPGTWRAVALGNVDPLLWLGVGLALLVPALRGVALAAVALVKPYAMWPLAVAVVREGRSVAISALTLIGMATAGTAIVMGPARLADSLLAWVRYVPPLVGQGTWLGWNVSLPFLPLRLLRALGWLGHTSGPLPSAARLWLALASVAGPTATVWVARHEKPLMQYSMVMAAAVLCSPLAWASYLPFALAPIALRRAGARGRGAESNPPTGERGASRRPTVSSTDG